MTINITDIRSAPESPVKQARAALRQAALNLLMASIAAEDTRGMSEAQIILSLLVLG